MSDVALDGLLASCLRDGMWMERRTRDDFDHDLLEELHRLADQQMREDFEHFCVHAWTNDVLYVFRAAAGDVLGFQFWRTLDAGSHRRVVLGGKLRIRRESRRSGLHHVAALSVLLRERRAHPEVEVVRIAFASLFGFVSITGRVARFDLVRRGSSCEGLIPLVHELTRPSDFAFDEQTGQVDVRIFMSEAELAAYPASYFERPLAQLYAEHNPGYRTNGRYLALAFDVDATNLRSLIQGAAETAMGAGEPAERWAREVTELAGLKPPSTPGSTDE